MSWHRTGLTLLSVMVQGWLLVGCAASTGEQSSESGLPPFATYQGGVVTEEDVESRLQDHPVMQASRFGERPRLDREEWFGLLEDTAMLVAYEELLVPKRGLLKLEASPEVLEQIRREAVVDRYIAVQRAQAPQELVTQEHVASFYKERPEYFERVEMRHVWHLFRRQRDGQSMEDVLGFLRRLKSRMDAGEPFRVLAQEHSESETRRMQGRLGWIGRGRLPASLETRVFELEVGRVSDPIVGGGGATLFLVTEVQEERSIALEEASVIIAKHLREAAFVEFRSALAAAMDPPAGSTTLTRQDLMKRLGIRGEEQILRVGECSYTASELAAEAASMETRELRFETQEELVFQLYQARRDRCLISLRADAEGFKDELGQRDALDALVEAAVRARLVEERSLGRVEDLVADSPQQLRAFHQENDHLFQTSLRIEIAILSVSLEGRGVDVVPRMERLRADLVSGRAEFVEAAEELGGTVSSPVWLDEQGMRALDRKVQVYLLDLGGTGYSVPFQLNGQMNLVWVKNREEPRILSFEEAETQVREHYKERYGQDLYGQVVRELLEENDYRFEPTAAQRLLQVAERGSNR